MAEKLKNTQKPQNTNVNSTQSYAGGYRDKTVKAVQNQYKAVIKVGTEVVQPAKNQDYLTSGGGSFGGRYF